MALFGFRLQTLATILTRSRHTDDDVITFGVVVNEKARGQCSGRSPAFGGTTMDMAYVPATVGSGSWDREFLVGPFDIEPDDTIRVFYSVTNIGDTLDKFSRIEGTTITLEPTYWPLARTLAATFDAYLQPEEQRHAAAI